VEPVGDVLAALYRALGEGDLEWFRGRLRHGTADIHIGPTDEYWSSVDAFLTVLARRFGELTIAWTAGDAVVTDLGDVAVVADRPTLAFDDGSTIRARLTLVLARADDAWLLAHTHFSMGNA
jgi:hypothetical protein